MAGCLAGGGRRSRMLLPGSSWYNFGCIDRLISDLGIARARIRAGLALLGTASEPALSDHTADGGAPGISVADPGWDRRAGDRANVGDGPDGCQSGDRGKFESIDPG